MNYKRLEMIGPEGETIKSKTPVNGANPYVDNYTGFTWNNIHSSSYNCFIENTGHLEFVGAPDFSNNFVSPAFQTRTYYTGMQNSSKKFSLNLVFYQLTLKELNAAFKWLDRTIVSDLFFDYEPYWKYSCKLSSIGTMEKYVSGRTMYRGKPCDLYLCRVAIQFETVYHPEAISAYCAYKYTNDAYDSTDDFHEYSRTTGSNYMPFNEWKTAKFGVAPFERTLPKSWRPMIITSKDYERITENQAYWRFALKNPSAYPTYFKLHFYNVASNISVYQYWNNDWFNNGDGASLGPVDDDGWVLPGELDIDAYENSMCICTTSLNLDDDIWLDLHYNSEDGTVLCANQLVEQLRTGDSNIPCTHKDAVANVYLPGAVDSDHPSTVMIEVTIDRRVIDSPKVLKTISASLYSGTRSYTASFSASSKPLRICAGASFTVWPASHATSQHVVSDEEIDIDFSWKVLASNNKLTVLARRNEANSNIEIRFNMADGDGTFDINSANATLYYYTHSIFGVVPQMSVEYDTYEYMI